MIVFVLNCGSSSVKFQLIDTATGAVRAKGAYDKIGAGGAPDHKTAIEAAYAGLGADARAIAGVGHRMVHGGERFHASALIDAAVERAIDDCCSLAPLHNPHNLKGYRVMRELMPRVPQVAVFDTAFHQTLPARAYVYPLPYELYRDHGVRRFGFHGTSHRYVSGRFAEMRGREDLKLIVCHLGNGCSVCAVDAGRSVDISLGFTPLEGLMMGTRPGDLDPGVVLYLRERGHDVNAMFNKQSGLLGVSGVSNDMRDVLAASEAGRERARLAVEMFCYRVRKYIGAYMAVLGGCDAVLFTGGIGENAWQVRERVCAGLERLGVAFDAERNRGVRGVEAEIGEAGSGVETWVIPTNEELLIARDTAACIA